MKALVAAVVLALVVVVAPGAGAATKKPVVRCHWVKATRKTRRHKVCVRVKAKAKSKTTKKVSAVPSISAPAASAPATATPSAPSPAPAAPAPAVTPPTLAPAPAPVADDPAPPALTRLQATTREWSITLSRPAIAAGALSLQLVNAGEDAHDLHVRPASGGADLLSASSTQPGTNATISGSLPAGTYTLYCSLPSHESLGMHATLTVAP